MTVVLQIKEESEMKTWMKLIIVGGVLIVTFIILIHKTKEQPVARPTDGKSQTTQKIVADFPLIEPTMFIETRPAEADIKQQLLEVEKYLSQNDVYTQIKQFESSREEFYQAIILKQSLIEKLSEIEIANSKILLGGTAQ